MAHINISDLSILLPEIKDCNAPPPVYIGTTPFYIAPLSRDNGTFYISGEVEACIPLALGILCYCPLYYLQNINFG